MAGQQIRTPLPVYTAGTVAGNAGSAVIAGTNTNWTTLDSSGNVVNSVMGGDVFITATQAIPIKSVDSATQVTLEIPLSATLNAGSAYRIIKVSPNLTGGVTSALGVLQAQGSDTQADASRTIDSGAGRLKLRIGAAGDAQIAVGPSGAADAALTTAIDIAQSGTVSFPKGITATGDGPLAGFRNLIINGNFAINQRGYTSGAAIAAGAYAHDRWYLSASGSTSYSFAQAPIVNNQSPPGTIDTVITLPNSNTAARQVIEPANIAGGQYTLSWSGTVVGSVLYFNGSSYVQLASGASPLTVSNVPAGVSVLIQLVGPGTISNVQFEPGPVATPFERRHFGMELLLCQRYYAVISNITLTSPAAANFGISMPFGVVMRATPTVATIGTPTYNNAAGANAVANSPNSAQFYFSCSAANGYVTGWTVSLSAEL